MDAISEVKRGESQGALARLCEFSGMLSAQPTEGALGRQRHRYLAFFEPVLSSYLSKSKRSFLHRNGVLLPPTSYARRLLPARLRRSTSLSEGGLLYTRLIQIGVIDIYEQLIPKGFLREEAVGAAD